MTERSESAEEAPYEGSPLQMIHALRAEVERLRGLLNKWTLTRLDGGQAHKTLHVETMVSLDETGRSRRTPGHTSALRRCWQESDMDAKDKSIRDTQDHQDRVSHYLNIIVEELQRRAENHDDSKLKDPELSLFAEWGPRLKELEYGSDAYKAALVEMGAVLKHHYEHNRHHPEHFAAGVRGMNVVDFVEMICDWAAAAERMKDGSFLGSLDYNKNRFLLNPEVVGLIKNTAKVFEEDSNE